MKPQSCGFISNYLSELFFIELYELANAFRRDAVSWKTGNVGILCHMHIKIGRFSATV